MIDVACMCICLTIMRAFMRVQLQGLQDENKALRQDNATLAGEVEQMNRVASYVGSRVAKVLAGARRANNYNAALVGELKRWNRKLEVWCSVMLLHSTWFRSDLKMPFLTAECVETISIPTSFDSRPFAAPPYWGC